MEKDRLFRAIQTVDVVRKKAECCYEPWVLIMSDGLSDGSRIGTTQHLMTVSGPKNPLKQGFSLLRA